MEMLPEGIPELYEQMQGFLDTFQMEENRKALQGYLAQMKQIQNLFGVTKYRIVFIGAPGEGKTTAICNWLNLLRSEKKEKINRVPLLSTSQGRTTVAEVHICQTDGPSLLRIEYLSDEQQEALIRSCCKLYYATCLGDGETLSEEEAQDVHIEYDRAVKNMASLEDYPGGSSERTKKKQEKIRSFLLGFADEEAFEKYVLDTIHIETRKCPEVVYTGEEAFEDWLQRTFNDINDGKNPDCGIPKRVYVEVAREDLDMKLPSFVSEIIDTKGLNTNVRTDLQELLKAEDTVCYIVNKLSIVPSMETRTLLSDTFLTEWDRYYVHKTSLFVRCSDAELEDVKNANSPEEGMDIKRSQIDAILLGGRIPYNTENTIFLDACRAYELRTKRVTVEDEETGQTRTVKKEFLDGYYEADALAYREDLNRHIEERLRKLKSLLKKDASTIREGVLSLLEREEEYEEQSSRKELLEVKKKVEKVRESGWSRFQIYDEEDVCQAVLKKAVVDYRRRWQTLRNLNACHGGDPKWRENIYSQISQAGRILLADMLNPFEKEMKRTFDQAQNARALAVLKGYEKKLEEDVSKAVDVMGNRFLSWSYLDRFATEENEYNTGIYNSRDLARRLEENLAFWDNVSYDKLKGSGYTFRVEELYRQHIQEDCIGMVDILWGEMGEVMDLLLTRFPPEEAEFKKEQEEKEEEETFWTDEEEDEEEEEEEEYWPYDDEEEDDEGEGEEEEDEGEKDEVEKEDKANISPALPEGEAFKKLQGLVGLTNIKEDVVSLVNLMKIQARRKRAGMKELPLSLHLVFLGNPGTGKTTVARILGSIYKEIGILSGGQVVEVDRKSLVGEYVGQTAIKTGQKIDEAMGGVLFVDEAYTLAKGGNDFGQEAIDTIMKAMEDHRENLVVIVAGYADEMEAFLKSNPGIQSRFNRYFVFEDYTAEELYQVFDNLCREYDFLLTGEAEQVAREKFAQMIEHKSRGFANAREVRNYFEQVTARQATRLSHDPQADLRVLTEEDM